MYIGSRLFSKVAKYLTLSFASLAASVICALLAQRQVQACTLHLTAPHTLHTLILHLCCKLLFWMVLDGLSIVHQAYAQTSQDSRDYLHIHLFPTLILLTASSAADTHDKAALLALYLLCH